MLRNLGGANGSEEVDEEAAGGEDAEPEAAAAEEEAAEAAAGEEEAEGEEGVEDPEVALQGESSSGPGEEALSDT